MYPNYQRIMTRLLILCVATVGVYWLVSLVRPDIFVITVTNHRVIALFDAIERAGVLATPIYAVFSGGVMLCTLLICTGRTRLTLCGWVAFGLFVVVTAVYRYCLPSLAFMADLCLLLPIVTMCRHVWRVALLRYIVLSAACIMYQWAISAARGVVLDVAATIGRLPLFLMSVDYYAFVLGIFIIHVLLIGGETYGCMGKLVFWQAGQCAAQDADEATGQDCKTQGGDCGNQAGAGDPRRLTRWRIRLLSELPGKATYLTVFAVMGLTAWVTHKYIETILFFVAYLGLRWTFPHTFHASRQHVCLLVSSITFCVAVAVLPPIEYTLTGGVFLAYLLAWGLYVYRDRTVWRTAYVGLSRSDIIRADKLRRLCVSSGLTQAMALSAVDWLIHGMSAKEQAAGPRGGTVDAINKRRRRITTAIGIDTVKKYLKS